MGNTNTNPNNNETVYEIPTITKKNSKFKTNNKINMYLNNKNEMFKEIKLSYHNDNSTNYSNYNAHIHNKASMEDNIISAEKFYFEDFFKVFNIKIKSKILLFLLNDIKKLLLVNKTWKKEILKILKYNFSNINFQFKNKYWKYFIYTRSYIVITNIKAGVRIDKLIKFKVRNKYMNKNFKLNYFFEILKSYSINFNNKNSVSYSNFDFNYIENSCRAQKVVFVEHLKNENNEVMINLCHPDIIYTGDDLLLPITIYSGEGLINGDINFSPLIITDIDYLFLNKIFNNPVKQDFRINKRFETMSWNYSPNDKRNRLIPITSMTQIFNLNEICSMGNEIIIVKALFTAVKKGKIDLKNKYDFSFTNNKLTIRIIDKPDKYENVLRKIGSKYDIYDSLNLKINDELVFVVTKYIN